jgi:hypothetical protein
MYEQWLTCSHFLCFTNFFRVSHHLESLSIFSRHNFTFYTDTTNPLTTTPQRLEFLSRGCEHISLQLGGRELSDRLQDKNNKPEIILIKLNNFFKEYLSNLEERIITQQLHQHYKKIRPRSSLNLRPLLLKVIISLQLQV